MGEVRPSLSCAAALGATPIDTTSAAAFTSVGMLNSQARTETHVQWRDEEKKAKAVPSTITVDGKGKAITNPMGEPKKKYDSLCTPHSYLPLFWPVQSCPSSVSH